MRAMRIYLDACCLNRPFDDQSQLRIQFESEAVIAILKRAEKGDWIMLSSTALTFELGRIPNLQRRIRTQKLLSIAQELVAAGPRENLYAKKLQELYGLRALDALHLACSETLRADVFLTTDDRLLRACSRMTATDLSVVVANPLAWLTEVLSRE